MTNDNLLIYRIPLGPMGNLVYIIADKETKKAAVIDPAWDVPAIIKEAKKSSLRIDCGLLTHGHYDHSDGAKELAKEFNMPIYISENEIKLYWPDCPNIKKTKDKEEIALGNSVITCIHTPGHAPGCQCFLIGKHLFTGDTLFVNACGRCDLPGGNAKAMYHTLYKVIGKLPDEVIIYPGHAYGPRLTSTLGQERKTNPYLTCVSEKDFLENRMG